MYVQQPLFQQPVLVSKWASLLAPKHANQRLPPVFTPTCLSIEVEDLAGPIAAHTGIVIDVCTTFFTPTCLSIDVDHLVGPETRHPEVVINVYTAAIRVAQNVHRFWAEVSQYPFVSYGKTMHMRLASR